MGKPVTNAQLLTKESILLLLHFFQWETLSRSESIWNYQFYYKKYTNPLNEYNIKKKKKYIDIKKLHCGHSTFTRD